MLNIREKIEKRIKEIKIIRNSLTTSGSRNKYNFTIGELEWIMEELKQNHKN